MRLEKCWFCSSTCYPGHGITFVRNDSKVRAPPAANRLWGFRSMCRAVHPGGADDDGRGVWDRVAMRPPLPCPRKRAATHKGGGRADFHRRRRMRRMRRQVFKFCRSKCHNNFKMKRNPRKVAWTKAYRAGHGKDLAEDATFDLERRRNRPEKYNRVLVHKSVKAMKKILDIRKARQDRFYENRCAAAPSRPAILLLAQARQRQRRRRRESAVHSARPFRSSFRAASACGSARATPQPALSRR